MMVFKFVFAKDSLIVLSNRFNLTYDVYSNLYGGIRKGTVYRNLMQMGTEISSKYLKNTLLNIKIANAGGQSPSSNLVGDLQTISNIDADVSLFIYELYLRYVKNKTWLKFGIHNLNEDFVLCEHASDLINSSFGIPSLITVNSFASVYPKTTLGLSFSHDFSILKLKTAVFDGFPDKLYRNDLAWGIHLYDGIVHILEVEKNVKNNLYRIGLYNYTGCLTENEANIRLVPNHFIYSVVSGSIDSSKQYFIQFAKSLKASMHHYYLGTGFKINYTIRRMNLSSNFGLAYAGNTNKSKDEIVLEFANSFQIAEKYKITPDFQYIINPSGTNKHLSNSFVLILRCQLMVY